MVATQSKAEIYENIAGLVCRLERPALVHHLTHFEGDLTLDFSPEYLDTCSTDQIRHLLVAALWRCELKRLA